MAAGIYKITNTITGNFYIGQSTNIERRFMEHKTPKGASNKRLHSDMVSYGNDKFKFEIVEECEKEKLDERELFYIRLLLPYYNTIGKPIPENVKERLRECGKKQWERMTEEEKRRRIEKNLIGPKKGHKVSKETREKLRNANIGKRVYRPVYIVETGETFSSPRECAKFLGVTSSAVLYNLKGKTNYTKGYRIRYKQV